MKVLADGASIRQHRRHRHGVRRHEKIYRPNTAERWQCCWDRRGRARGDRRNPTYTCDYSSAAPAAATAMRVTCRTSRAMVRRPVRAPAPGPKTRLFRQEGRRAAAQRRSLWFRRWLQPRVRRARCCSDPCRIFSLPAVDKIPKSASLDRWVYEFTAGATARQPAKALPACRRWPKPDAPWT